MPANGWLRMELRYLAALDAIAATGSFGRAAEELGYTQSAVSNRSPPSNGSSASR